MVKLTHTAIQSIQPAHSLYWRGLGGGHLLQVESCPGGVTWGVGYDSTAWCYTGGWGGGGQPGGQDTHTLTDQKYFYIYENQRWNPLTGFTSAGLPTDRPCWSDRSGRHPAAKDSVRLPSGGWVGVGEVSYCFISIAWLQVWAGDWTVDHHTPGGTDQDGWQFAKDFPASYHPSQTFTDYVRRRRWARRCRLVTTGPWRELGTTRLVSLSLAGTGDRVRGWAVATNGEALHRLGVTQDCPAGTAWSHVR